MIKLNCNSLKEVTGGGRDNAVPGGDNVAFLVGTDGMLICNKGGTNFITNSPSAQASNAIANVGIPVTPTHTIAELLPLAQAQGLCL